MSHPHLDRAPIVEAIVDIRVVPELTSLEILESFKREAAGDFPEQRRVLIVTSNLDARDESAPKVTTTNPETKGYACWTTDKRRVVQARVNGFSFSHLAPYDRWESLRDDAQAWWKRYRDSTQPGRVARCALRFINRIELPLPIGDLDEYFGTVPKIGDGLPQTLSGLFMRLVVPFDGGATAIITQAVEDGRVTPKTLPIVLDVDVFREVDLAPDGNDVWTCLDELRQVKNDVFFKSLKPKALDLFR